MAKTLARDLGARMKSMGVAMAAGGLLLVPLSACASSADGAPAPETGSAEVQAERSSVIVMLDIPEFPTGDALQSLAGVTRAQAMVSSTRRRVLTDVFGPDGVADADVEGETRPVVLRSFSITPAFALRASQVDLDRLRAHPQVIELTPDTLARPTASN